MQQGPARWCRSLLHSRHTSPANAALVCARCCNRSVCRGFAGVEVGQRRPTISESAPVAGRSPLQATHAPGARTRLSGALSYRAVVNERAADVDRDGAHRLAVGLDEHGRGVAEDLCAGGHLGHRGGWAPSPSSSRVPRCPCPHRPSPRDARSGATSARARPRRTPALQLDRRPSRDPRNHRESRLDGC